MVIILLTYTLLPLMLTIQLKQRVLCNGCLEGVNRRIKQIERTAYGYSSFRYLLIRIRLEENIIKEKEPNNYFQVA